MATKYHEPFGWWEDTGATTGAQRVVMVDGTTGAVVESSPGASSVLYVPISTAASGGTDLVAAAGSGNRIRVINYVIVAAGTVNVKFTSGTGPTDLTGAMPLVANSGISATSDRWGLFATAANAKLSINLSAAVQVSGHLAYVITT